MNDWFKKWFGASYKSLYRRRDTDQARLQIESLISRLSLSADASILDVGCGAGRHIQVFGEKGFPRAAGLDLSLSLLADARTEGQNVLQGDMRHLPFPAAAFDLVTCFFTSFGYFATLQEDMDTLSGFTRVLRPGGHLFLDLINKRHLQKNLVTQDQQDIDGVIVRQKRRIEDGMVVKEIEIISPSGHSEIHQERVRLYSMQDMLEMGRPFGLSFESAFGSEQGEPYDAENSPRMGLLLARATENP